MPRRREPLKQPRDYMIRGEWPHGVFTKDAPLAAHVLRDIVVKVRAELEEQGITQHYLAGMANLDRSTIRLILNGYKWPDMVTIVKMEQQLGRWLWPRYFPGDEIEESANRSS